MLNIDAVTRYGLKARDYIVRQDLLLAIVVALAVIVVGVSFGWENNKVVPVNAAASARYTQEAGKSLSFMANWDGPDYLTIAQHGYTFAGQASFFPLYPLAVHVIDLIIGSPLYSGLLVAWASLVGAVCFYLKIIKQLFKITDNLEALRGALLFVLFPTGVFLLATYTESLFAFLALGALYYALEKRYLPAALFAMLSTATHVNGLFVLVLVALVLWEQKEKLTKILATLVIGSLGLVAYMIFLQVHFNNALAFVSAQKSHGWLQYGYADFATEIASLNGLFLLFVLTAVVYWWRRRKSFSVYSLLYVGIALLGGLGGFGRYALMVFPLQFMFYDYFRDKKLGYAVVIAIFSIFWTYFTLQYAGGYSGG
jgi:hypothetical protein